MKRIFIQLEKSGDQLSLAPILHAEYLKTGHRTRLLVSKQYQEIPQALDYVETIVFDGHWQDLKGAIRLAKQLGGELAIPQTFGNDFPIQRKHPSFQYDQWNRAGYLEQWGKLPLVLPPVKPHRFERPTILFGDHSESSPFPHKEELNVLLQDSFPRWHIVRLSSIRLASILDLVALYDGADLLVSIDTCHLHLSAASRTPLIALVTDVPSRWHGSCHHPRMAAHIRYGDYLNRKGELLHIARKCLDLKKSG